MKKYCIVPLSWVALTLHSLGNYTRGAIIPEMCEINQSSVDFHYKPFDWLIDWFTASQLYLDWFIGFVPPDLFLRRRGLSDSTQRDDTVRQRCFTGRKGEAGQAVRRFHFVKVIHQFRYPHFMQGNAFKSEQHGKKKFSEKNFFFFGKKQKFFFFFWKFFFFFWEKKI